MQKIVLILGGARSGKSTYALGKALSQIGRKAFVATAEALDDEMAIRIAAHRKERGNDWDTYEEPKAIGTVIESIRDTYDVIIIDCLTLWVSNLILAGADIARETATLCTALSGPGSAIVYIVSNEVGMGLVPDTALGRSFRDALGFVNREIAGIANDVSLLVAGIPIHVKGAS